MTNAIQNGLTAEEILNATVFREAMAEVDAIIMRSLKQCKEDGKPETARYRDHLYACLRVSDMVKQQIVFAMNTGKVEAARFQQKKPFRSGL